MFFALAPIVTIGHIKSPIRLLSDIPDSILFDIFGRKDFLPNSELIDFLADTLCKDKATRFVCDDIIFLLCGFDLSNLNQSRLPVYMSHTPAGTSTQNMIHYTQMVRTNAFQMYNYDSREENIKHYGQATPPLYNVSKMETPVALFTGGHDWLADPTATPPLYNVSKMETPVALFTGGHDWLADPTDVAALIHQLKNITTHVNVPKYNHLDFIWGMDAYKLIYQTIVQMIREDVKKSC